MGNSARLLRSAGTDVNASPVMVAAARLVPRRMKQYLRAQHRQFVLARAIRAMRDLPPGAQLSAEIIDELIYGWENAAWSASAEYIRALLRCAWQTTGPILECGSGLSTILLGIVAQRTGNKVLSLEHDPYWAQRVESALARYGIASCEICLVHLRRFDGYAWYAVPEHRLPADFAFVACDGPPGHTPGGRYGLLPQMRRRLRPGCVVLLDDAQRSDERQILARWACELDSERTVIEFGKSFALLTVPRAPA